MKAAGAVLVDPADFPTKGQFDEDELTVLLYEFKDGLNRYLSALPASAPARSLEQLIVVERRASRDGDAVVRPGALR